MIPIFGLPHRVNILRYEEEDDGAGGVTLGDPSIIYEGLACRLALLTAEDEQKSFGNTTGKRWTVVARPAPDVRFNDFLKLGKGGRAAPIDCDAEYRIIHTQLRQDHNGNRHHTSIICELEDD